MICSISCGLVGVRRSCRRPGRSRRAPRPRAPGRRRAARRAAGDDAAQRRGERHAHLPLLVRREEVDDAVDRLGRADRVQRREHEVTGLGRGQRGPHRLDRRASRRSRITSGSWRSTRFSAAWKSSVSVPTSRWLTIELLSGCRISIGSSIVTMCVVAGLVDVVDHRAERRRLARAGRAGDEDETALVLGELAHDRRQPELLERGDVAVGRAADERDRAALLEDVDAEATEAGDRVGEVGLAGILEFGQRTHLGDVVEGLLGVLRGQRLIALDRGQLAVQPHGRRHAHLDVEVRALPLDQGLQR